MVLSPSRHKLFSSLYNIYLKLLSRQAVTTSPTKFHHFPLLPVELRLQIWQFSFPSDRSTCISLTSRTARQWAEEYTFTYPSTLHTNRESRHETLRCYKLICNLSSGDFRDPWPICFNPQIDRVRVQYPSPSYRQWASCYKHKLEFLAEVEVLQVDFKEWNLPWLREETLARMKWMVDEPFRAETDNTSPPYLSYLGLDLLFLFKELKAVRLCLPREAQLMDVQDKVALEDLVRQFLKIHGNSFSGRQVELSIVFEDWEDKYKEQHLA